MKIQIDEKTLEGTALEIVRELREMSFEPIEFESMESYMEYQVEMIYRLTDIPFVLDGKNDSENAELLLNFMASLDILEVIDDE